MRFEICCLGVDDMKYDVFTCTSFKSAFRLYSILKADSEQNATYERIYFRIIRNGVEGADALIYSEITTFKGITFDGKEMHVEEYES